MDNVQLPSRADRVALYITAAVAAAVIVLTVATAITRLIEVAPGEDVPVLVPIDGERTSLPIGPDGSAYPAAVESATVVVSEPAPATLFALWAEPIFTAAMISALAVVGAAFLLRIARGRIFERGSVRLFYVGVGMLAALYLIGTILTNMTTYGALSAISDYGYDAITFEIGFGYVYAFLVLGGVGAALEIGERMRRDTAGLV